MIKVLIIDTKENKVLIDETVSAVIGGLITKEQQTAEGTMVDGRGVCFGRASAEALISVAEESMNAVKQRMEDQTKEALRKVLDKLGAKGGYRCSDLL